MFNARIITLYPEMFPGPLGHSLAGRALKNGSWAIKTIQLRDFATSKHKNVDDTPAGGGPGMVLRPDILAAAIDQSFDVEKPKYLLSPRGKPITQDFVHECVSEQELQLICGRFEGIDQRVIDTRNLIEISLGDFILSGGELAALCLIDACVRLLPGVMGDETSGVQESFENGLLEHDHYTKPQDFEGKPIPQVLLSGHHAKIEKWRLQNAQKLTQKRRKDLWDDYCNKLDKNS